jgi:hypothetical protein
VQQLKNYDEAFGKFFDRLAAASINKSNTLEGQAIQEEQALVLISKAETLLHQVHRAAQP